MTVTGRKMTVLHEPAECDRQRNAERVARLARMSPKPIPKLTPVVIVAPVEPKPILAEAKPVECVPVPDAVKERVVQRYRKSAYVVDKGNFGMMDVVEAPAPTIMHVKTIVAKHYNTSVLHLESAQRNRRLCYARHIAVYLCAEMTRRSLPTIGLQFGGRDHTTQIHSRNKVARMAAESETLRNELDALKTWILATMDDGDSLPHGDTVSEHSGASSS